MDLATSSSASEAFPLAVGEGMACATPVVVTDVGDSALIVGETGKVVAPRDPVALAAAWRALIEAGPDVRRCLGMAARRRVQRHFDLTAIVERYQAIYAQLAGGTLQRMPSSSRVRLADEICPAHLQSSLNEPHNKSAYD
jgi:glycosyltransferase involved in cell wall biosynthesis